MARKLTNEEFYDRVNKIHDGKYTYVNDFTNTRSKITAICPIHGEFKITAKRHLLGQGCPKCGKEYAKNCRKGNWMHFIESVANKFGDIFSFPNIESEYVNEKSSVTVKCNKCGFEKNLSCNYILSERFNGECSNCKHLFSFKDILNYNKTKYNIVKFDGLKDDRTDFISMVCDNHGKYDIRLSTLLNGNGNCNKCSGYSRLISEQVIKERINNKFEGKIKPISSYKGAQVPMEFICTEGHKFTRTFNSLMFGNIHDACPICSRNELSLERTKTMEEFKKEFYDIFGKDDYDLSESVYTKANEPITIKCNICGEYFTKTPYLLLKGFGCNNHGNRFKSSMEQEIENMLMENKIEYIKQYRVDWLNNKSLDFYLPTYNTAIECQGKQHFESVEYFGGIEEFEKRKLRDKIKFKECIDNNVRLLYYADYTYDFPYEVITDKNNLLLEIMNGKEINK